MSDYRYVMNGPHYVLTDDGKFIGPPLLEIAVGFDKEDGIVRKHGAVAMVERWASDTRAKLRAGGLHDWADNLIVLSGKLDIEAINRYISTSGYAKRYFASLQAHAPSTSKELPQ